MPPDGTRRESRPSAMGVGQVERVLLLRTFPGLADASSEIITAMAEHARESHFLKGDYVFREATPVTAIHMLVHGRVRLLRNGRVVRELGEKTVIGGITAFASDPRGYDVVALEDLVTLEMRVEDMLDIFEDHFPILQSVMRAVAGELIDVRRTLPGTAGYSQPEPADVETPPDRPLDLVERIALVRQTLAFAKSRLDAVAELAREATEVRLPAGSVLWKEGEPSDFMLMLVSGIVRCHTSEGHRFGFTAGDVVGSMDSAAGRARWFTAETETEIWGLRIDSEALYDVFEDDFEMALDLLSVMATGLMWILDQRASLLAMPEI